MSNPFPDIRRIAIEKVRSGLAYAPLANLGIRISGHADFLPADASDEQFVNTPGGKIDPGTDVLITTPICGVTRKVRVRLS